MKKLFYLLSASAAVATPIVATVACGTKSVKVNADTTNKSAANIEDDNHRKEAEIKEMNAKIHEAAQAHAIPAITQEVQTLNAADVKKEMLTIPSKDGVRFTVQSLQASGTDLSIEVLVASDVDGTETETYTETLHGFNPLTSDEIAKEAATAKVNEQKQLAQALVDKIANEKTVKLDLTEDAKTLTAVKLRQTNFVEKQVTEGTTTVTISATNIIRVASQPSDGTAAIVQLKVSSPIEGVEAKFYEVQVEGLVSQLHFAAEHNFQISASAHNPMTFANIKLDPATNGGARGGVARYGSMMMESFVMSMGELMGYKFQDTDLTPAVKGAPAAVEGYESRAEANAWEKGIQTIWKSSRFSGAFGNVKNAPTAWQKTPDPVKQGFTSIFSGSQPTNINQPNANIYKFALGDTVLHDLLPITDANAEGAYAHATQKLPDNFFAQPDATNTQETLDAARNRNIWAAISGFPTAAIEKSPIPVVGTTYHRMLPDAIPQGANTVLYKVDEATKTLHIWLKNAVTTSSSADLAKAQLKNAMDAIKDNSSAGSLSMALAEIFPEGKEGSMYMGKDAWNKDGRLDVLGKNLDAWTDKTSDGVFKFNGASFQISKYSTWIDGTNPGHTKAWINITTPKTWSAAGTQLGHFTLESTAAIVPKFRIAEGQRWEELKNSLLASMKNLNTQFGNNDTLNILNTAGISPTFINMLQYVSNNYSMYSDNELLAMFDKLNNGSFDTYALEYAARGITAMPDCVYPDMSNIIKSMASSHLTKGELSGFASFTSPLQLAPWFYAWSDDKDPAAARRAAGYSSPTDATFYWTAPVAN